MKLHIQRYRYVIVRDRKEIFCELYAQGNRFKDIDGVGGTAIKTYPSEQEARKDFLMRFGGAKRLIDAGRVEFVEVVESLGTPDFSSG